MFYIVDTLSNKFCSVLVLRFLSGNPEPFTHFGLNFADQNEIGKQASVCFRIFLNL